MSITEIYQTALASGDLRADTAQVAVLPEFDRIKAAIETPIKKGWFSKKPPIPKGLYLWGGVGRGKSTLMDLFAQHTPNTQRVHFHAFMQDVHAKITEVRKQGVDDAIIPVAEQIAQGIKCLAFDEMQITDITDAMIVGRLFEQLMQRDIVIIATSNRHPDDLYKNGLNRALFLPFIDVLKQKMVVHELASPTDYRQDRLAGSKVYFTPLDNTATAQMDLLWSDLTGGNGQTLDLNIGTRTVTLRSFRNGVARVMFDDLCNHPLGAADYLGIVGAVSVLMIDNVPLLGPANANEAKRFVTLIDTLYEARTKVIISAAAPPENLYPNGTGSFEFERTASRLREMQAADWAG